VRRQRWYLGRRPRLYRPTAEFRDAIGVLAILRERRTPHQFVTGVVFPWSIDVRARGEIIESELLVRGFPR
jgi:hypothetical protein